MDQLNMNYIKHPEKTNAHTQITKSNIIQRSGQLFFFFRKCNMCSHVNKVGHGDTFCSGCHLKKFQHDAFLPVLPIVDKNTKRLFDF